MTIMTIIIIIIYEVPTRHFNMKLNTNNLLNIVLNS